MKRPSSTQQWSRRRTEALLSLCKTAAPPDFRAQVLARVHERQQRAAAAAAPPPQHALTRRWQQGAGWLREMRLRTLRGTTLAPAAGSVCILLLSGALLWWIGTPGGGAPTPPRGDGALASLPAFETPGTPQDERLAGVRDSQAHLPLVTILPASGDPVLPHGLQQTADDSTAAGDRTRQEPAWLPPPIPLLQSASDPPPLLKTEPRRFQTKRALPARPKRARKSQGMGKHVSA